MQRPDIATIGKEIQAVLGISDEAITYAWGDLSKVGALAMCYPQPAINRAHIVVDYQCPPAEVRPSIWHELVHVLLAPLTGLLPGSPADIMLEEKAVEKLTIAFGKVGQRDRVALTHALQGSLPARMRARVQALTRPNRRKRMGFTKEEVAAAIEALAAGDGAKALEMLQALLTAAATADAGPASDAAPIRDDAAGDGAPPMREDETDPAVARRARVPVAPVGDAETRRARATLRSIERDGVASLISSARLRGVELPDAVEREIVACPTREEAERLLRVAVAARGGGEDRAKSGARARTNRDAASGQGGGASHPAYTAEQLASFGLPEQMIREYPDEHKRNPRLANGQIDGARKRLSGGGNPWSAKEGK